jgi:hypothetical protein
MGKSHFQNRFSISTKAMQRGRTYTHTHTYVRRYLRTYIRTYIHINTHIHATAARYWRKPLTVDLFYFDYCRTIRPVQKPYVSSKVTCSVKVKVAKVWRRYQCNEIRRIKHNNFASFKILVVLLLKIKFFCDVIPCRMVNIYQSSEALGYLLQDKAFMNSAAWFWRRNY